MLFRSPCADTTDILGCAIYRQRLSLAGNIPHVLSERTVQFRWYLVVDSGRRIDGFYVADAGTSDEPSVRGHDAKGQSAQLRTQWFRALANQA